MFYFRLAALLRLPVSEMLARVSLDELREWMAFERIEPWGCRIEDHRFGLLASYMVNLLAPKSRHYKPSELFPPHSRWEREEQLQRQMTEIFTKMG